MKRILFPLAITLLVPITAFAENAGKCTTARNVTQEETRCTADAAQTLSPSADSERRSEDGVAGKEPASLSSEAARGKLQIGIPDLLVLNNRHWGKPQRITRNRETRAWHEYWHYEGANGGTQLHFINGRLASVADVEPPAPVAVMISPEVAEDR
jgi:hypothetical protein